MSITKKGKFAGNPQKAKVDTRFKASEDIDFGVGVEYTDTDDELATYSGGYFAGLPLEANEKIGEDEERDYDEYDGMKILKEGIAFVELAADVDLDTDGRGVGVDTTTANFGPSDEFTSVEGAAFLDSGSAGDEVRVRFNLPA